MLQKWKLFCESWEQNHEKAGCFHVSTLAWWCPCPAEAWQRLGSEDWSARTMTYRSTNTSRMIVMSTCSLPLNRSCLGSLRTNSSIHRAVHGSRLNRFEWTLKPKRPQATMASSFKIHGWLAFKNDQKWGLKRASNLSLPFYSAALLHHSLSKPVSFCCLAAASSMFPLLSARCVLLMWRFARTKASPSFTMASNMNAAMPLASPRTSCSSQDIADSRSSSTSSTS